MRDFQFLGGAINWICSAGKEDTPISVCRSRGLVCLERELLIARPELDKERLHDLNWQARRVAVIISIQRKPPASPLQTSSLVTAATSKVSESPVSGSSCRSPEIMVSVDALAREDGDGPHHQQQRISGVASPTHLNFYGEWDYDHKPYADIRRLYMKLYTRNADLWRLMIQFL